MGAESSSATEPSPLDEDRVVARRTALRGRDGVVVLAPRADDPHALATAARGGLDEHGGPVRDAAAHLSPESLVLVRAQ